MAYRENSNNSLYWLRNGYCHRWLRHQSKRWRCYWKICRLTHRPWLNGRTKKDVCAVRFPFKSRDQVPRSLMGTRLCGLICDGFSSYVSWSALGCLSLQRTLYCSLTVFSINIHFVRESSCVPNKVMSTQFSSWSMINTFWYLKPNQQDTQAWVFLQIECTSDEQTT